MFWGIPEWALGVAIIILAAGIGKAISGRGRKETEVPESRLAEVDDLERRLSAVEERLDFAERLLSQQRDAQRLGRT